MPRLLQLHITSAALIAALFLLVAFGSAGCGGEDPIRVYEAPKDGAAQVENTPAGGMNPHAASPMGSAQRIVGATIPVDDGAWFVKAIGPSDTLAAAADQVESFLSTVRFGGANGLEWQAPESWSELAPGQFATAKWVIDEARSVVVSVTHLSIVPFDDRQVLDNYNRWRNQVGLQPLDDTGMREESRVLDIDGRKAYFVNLAAAGGSQASDPHAGHDHSGHDHSEHDHAASGESATTEDAPAASGSPAAPGAMQWTLPAGWTEKGGSGMGRVATFGVEGESPVDISVTKFPGDVGGKLANVNRWRRQVGLEPIDEAAFDNAVEAIDVAGREILLVDAAGSSSRILALLIPAAGETWFVKTQAAPDQLDALVGPFRDFAQSVRFEGE